MTQLPPIIKQKPCDGTHRVLLSLSYDGTSYAGWQRQQNAVAVQQKVEEALTKLTGAPVTVTGASRTDAGVHALCQCAHFDTKSPIPAEKFPFALNPLLPPDIRIISGRNVSAVFHARFDACGKWYTYRIFNSPHASALYRNLTWHVPFSLDTDRMRESLCSILGTHDFAAFQAAGGTAKTTVRTIDFAELSRKEELLTLKLHGNAFLYNMVRIIAGTLFEIGVNRLEKTAFSQALQSKNRLSLGMTAPAAGLELTKVEYPERILE